ncbi:class I SAM-dependent methyltransferase [Bacillus alveayuensis]|jgi:tRNA G37 N-methylase Trm5|uniref:16S rRNA C1402 N4-methylase RsmH n=1 Tax=Aeribacillus alveayuensis TaxID=279215 RepID=A0ABT9VJ21_9BACI|nr:class I SAM-dependent methyltransferase [Bacillus alveayuensis]MDQ0160963.1 16S rRNA C1402 N4-methylase RsmH [Bacillus alveayuensis]
MKLDRILPFAKKLLETAVAKGDIVVDATVGNGHDTVFLAHLVGENGQVFGYDIQQEAIMHTKQKLLENNLLNRVTLFHQSHSEILKTIPAAYHGKIAGAMFNLGYLPGGDKRIVTKPHTTMSAIKQLLSILKREGIIVLVIYHGHQEGKVERDAVVQFVQSLDQKVAHVLEYRFINQKNNPPFIIAIEKC